MARKLFVKAIYSESLSCDPGRHEFGLWQASVTCSLREGGGQSMGKLRSPVIRAKKED